MYLAIYKMNDPSMFDESRTYEQRQTEFRRGFLDPHDGLIINEMDSNNLFFDYLMSHSSLVKMDIPENRESFRIIDFTSLYNSLGQCGDKCYWQLVNFLGRNKRDCRFMFNFNYFDN